MSTSKDVTKAVLEVIDWAALGEIYFHEDGEEELRGRRKAIVACGMALGEVLLPQLPRGGASLWVGAGIGELPVMLAEAMRGDRQVVAANLRTEECDLLNAALAQAAPNVPLRYEAADACVVRPGQKFDHLACISLFTDPETWPMLSDVTYGRIAPLQIEVETFVAEREEARQLAVALFARFSRPGFITTTAEEVSWFLEQAAAVEAMVEAGEELIEAAVVGDPIGILRIA